MTYVKNTIFHKLKKNRKRQPVYEDKSDTRRKVVIARGTLIWNFMIRTIFAKFWYILYYCKPTMNHYKNFYKNIGKKTAKNTFTITIIATILEFLSFKI